MQTRLLPSHAIAEAADLLQSGELVAFPTETVYGLGARVFDKHAIQAVFEAKGRPSDNPLIVHCADIQDLGMLVEPLTGRLRQLFSVLYDTFCPGPLTFVLPKKHNVPDSVTSGLQTVAVRFPAHPIAQELIHAVGEPLVAPSANRSGYPSPTCARHVLDDLEGRIAAVIDGGQCTLGIESTVVNFLCQPPVILRPGSITHEQLNRVVNAYGYEPFVDMSNIQHLETDIPCAPGMKYRHYAPYAPVMPAVTEQEALELAQRYAPALILARSEYLRCNLPDAVQMQELSEQRLYAALRYADREGKRAVVVLLDEEVRRRHTALVNRVMKAASSL
ncbi:MAG: L-threonylcarbamoyladenylate synthase [Bacteroidota bacterium]|nr:L-threonylcarbamoyladenylate synthase [Candidatus Kapabacteria bacterium]MDW8221269.1 L-threonylcarbamoyladenylate synthase [Bacteroidota bacterium]